MIEAMSLLAEYLDKMPHIDVEKIAKALEQLIIE